MAGKCNGHTIKILGGSEWPNLLSMVVQSACCIGWIDTVRGAQAYAYAEFVFVFNDVNHESIVTDEDVQKRFRQQ